MKFLPLLLSLFILGGCVGSEPRESPDLVGRGVEALPAEFSHDADLASDGSTEDTKESQASLNRHSAFSWLESFNSPDLNLLVEKAIEENYSLAQQATAVRLAEQSVRISRSELLPFLNLSVSAQRSDTGTAPANQYGLSLAAGYEVDLWGKLNTAQKRSQIDLANQRARYQEAERTLVRDVVNAGFDASSAEQLLGLLNQRFNNLTESLDVIERGYRSGLNDALDVYLSRNTLELERAGIANQQQVLFESLTRLELLLGEYPGAKLNVSGSLQSINLEPLEAGIPAGLLQRRPDIQQAWLDLLSADAGVAIAHRNRFPGLNLSASLSDSDQELGHLLDGGSLAWSVAASLVQPLFQGGRLAALEEQAKILLEQQEKRYLEVVFRALAEVENELSRGQVLNARYEAFVRAEQNANTALELAFDQYQRGLVPYTTVLESQRRAFDAQTTLIQLRNQQLKSRVNLLLALGGEY